MTTPTQSAMQSAMQSVIQSPMAVDLREAIEVTGDIHETRKAICAALMERSGLGVVSRRRYGLWSLAVRSVEDPTTWPICDTISHVQVAIADRIQTCATTKNSTISVIPKSAIVASLIRQIDPLPGLAKIESVVTRPIWSDGRWKGSVDGDHDLASQTICCLDALGIEALEYLIQGQQQANSVGLRAVAEAALIEIGRVCEGADWAAECDRGAWLTTVVAASTRHQWASAKGAPAPMLLVRSPAIGAGGGKSTLAHCVAAIAGSTATLTTEGVDAGEVQRQLGPILGDRVAVCVCDEIGSQRQNGVIDTYWHEVLTARELTIREVGSSRRVRTENHTIFVSTGIDPTYRGQTRRRVIAARLSGPARPQGASARGGMDPLEYCQAHEARLWACCSLIVWAYRESASPDVECSPRRPSYSDYDLARRAAIWAGAPDCYARSTDEDIDDSDLVAGTALLELIREAMIGNKTSSLSYRDLAPYIGMRPSDHAGAARLSSEVRRSAWPSDWRVVQRKINNANRYEVESQIGDRWVRWAPGDEAPGDAPDPLALEPVASIDAPVIIDSTHRVSLSAGVGHTDRSTGDPRRLETTIADLIVDLSGSTERKGSHYITPGYRQDTGDHESYARRELELESADIIGLDYDSASPDQVAALLAGLGAEGIAHVAATTYSHTIGNPRIRILLPISQPVDGPTYRSTWTAIVDRLARWGLGASADPAPCHLASVLYLGQAPGAVVGDTVDHPHWVIWRDGRAIRPVSPSGDRAPRPRIVQIEPVSPADRRTRVHAYLARIPASTCTPDLYRIVCRAGDIAADEGQLREAISRWVAANQPTHSTGETYSDREIETMVRHTIRYRQNVIGGAT